MSHLTDILPQRRGIVSEIARACGITHGAVSQWRQVPAGRVLDVERITGVPRHALRPDLYPPPTVPAGAPEHHETSKGAVA